MSWTAADLRADGSWRWTWTAAQLDALESWAVEVGPSALQAEPELASRVATHAPSAIVACAERVRRSLLDGHGLGLISGLRVEQYRPELLATMFVLFGATVGSLRSQNAAGHLLGHVTDVGADIDDPTTRIYQTNRRQTFHTDSTDAVALLCVRPAKSGGASMVVSVDTAYQRLAHEAPHLAERLFEPVATDRRGEQPAGEMPWFEIPVLSRWGDRVTGLYQRQYVDSAQRFEQAPKPDAEYIQALDRFDEIMNDPAVHFQMDFNPGDMQFVHNHSLLHDRTGFIDHADPGRRRHLLRLWMSLPGDRELPSTFTQRYGSITVGDRGGITVPGTTPTISFTP